MPCTLKSKDYKSFIDVFEWCHVMNKTGRAFQPKRIVEACMDFASAVGKKSRFDLIERYEEVMHVGRVGHFLQSIRCDVNGNSSVSKISFARLNKLAGTFGLDLIRIIKLRLSTGEKIIKRGEEDGEYIINIKTQDQLISCCYQIWSDAEEEGVLDKANQYLVLALIQLRVPQTKTSVISNFERKEIITQVLSDLMDLGLLSSYEEYLFNPELFKDLKKSTLDIITEFNVLPDRYMDSIDLVAKTPGIPIESLDEEIQSVLLNAGRFGFLVPIAVESRSLPTKYFVFTDPESMNDGTLPYETAAYFRFNECYALPVYGRLVDAQAFVRRLLERGDAGNATNIGINYRPIELKGVISVDKGFTSGRYRMFMRKKGVIMKTLSLLSESCDRELPWKEPPIWVNDPAAARAAETKKMNDSRFELMKLLRDLG